MSFIESFRLKPTSYTARVYALTMYAMFAYLFYFSAPANAEDDAYLRELEAEANRTETLGGKKQAGPHAKPKSKPKTTPISKPKVSQKKSPQPTNKKPTQFNTPAQAQTEKFEQLLQFERPSTYRFYKRLELSEKQQVVNDYYKHKKIPESSKLIFDLYFKHKK